MTPDQWFEVIHTNLCSLTTLTQPLFDAMCEQRDARIINVSSVNGQKGQFGQVNSLGRQAGQGFTKALAAEGPLRVTVNAIAPAIPPPQWWRRSAPMCSTASGRHSHAPPRQAAWRRDRRRRGLPRERSGGLYHGETLAINGGLYMK